mgnify:CR=1 FL=1
MTWVMRRQEARKIALAAQGFADPPRPGAINNTHFKRVLHRMRLLQLDSVQYLCRSHYLPVFSRLGPYSTAALDTYLHQGSELLETWAHEASLVTMQDEPLLRWRKQRAAQGDVWSHLYKLAKAKPQYVRAVQREVEKRGTLRASELDDHKASQGDWWSGQSPGKLALEWLFRIGAIGARRDHRFVRVYESWDQIVPAKIRSLPTPTTEEAQRALLLASAQAHGVGSLDCLADYFRIRKAEAKPRIAELVEEGALLQVELQGVKQPVYVDPEAKRPRKIKASTILTPFDPVVWNRKRAALLFDFDYRIEIYIPKEKRRYGYYVLPFLCGDSLSGRIEIKAERKQSTLHVVGAWSEADADKEELARSMAVSVRSLATHLQLETIRRPRKGSLARALSAELRSA